MRIGTSSEPSRSKRGKRWDEELEHRGGAWSRAQLLHVKRSNLNLFPHLIRVLPGHDPQYPGVDLELSGVIIHLISSWEHLGIPQEELEGVAEETDVLDTLLPLGPLQAKQNG